MKTPNKIKSYVTNKHCCQKHKSLVQITQIKNNFGVDYKAECEDCGNTVKGERAVRNLLVTTDPILTRFILNSANLN